MIEDLCKLCCYQSSISSCPITGLWCGILLFISRCRPSPWLIHVRSWSLNRKAVCTFISCSRVPSEISAFRIKSPSMNTHKCDLDQVKWAMWGKSHICSFGADQNVTQPSCSVQLILYRRCDIIPLTRGGETWHRCCLHTHVAAPFGPWGALPGSVLHVTLMRWTPSLIRRRVRRSVKDAQPPLICTNRSDVVFPLCCGAMQATRGDISAQMGALHLQLLILT